MFSPEANRYFTYILSSPSGTLYVGVTNDIKRRIAEHREGANKGFTKQYGCIYLVHVERFYDVREAITREKELKGWRREKKVHLIRTRNKRWLDLSRGWSLPKPRVYEDG